MKLESSYEGVKEELSSKSPDIHYQDQHLEANIFLSAVEQGFPFSDLDFVLPSSFSKEYIPQLLNFLTWNRNT